MPSTPNEETSVCNTGQEKFFTHHETPRDKYEIATAIIGPQSVHIANGVEGKAEIPVASNELEKKYKMKHGFLPRLLKSQIIQTVYHPRKFSVRVPETTH